MTSSPGNSRKETVLRKMKEKPTQNVAESFFFLLDSQEIFLKYRDLGKRDVCEQNLQASVSKILKKKINRVKIFQP